MPQTLAVCGRYRCSHNRCHTAASEVARLHADVVARLKLRCGACPPALITRAPTRVLHHVGRHAPRFPEYMRSALACVRAGVRARWRACALACVRPCACARACTGLGECRYPRAGAGFRNTGVGAPRLFLNAQPWLLGAYAQLSVQLSSEVHVRSRFSDSGRSRFSGSGTATQYVYVMINIFRVGTSGP